MPDNRRYKDGGTKEYKALTYKIVVWNRLLGEDSTYHKTSVFWFPNNFKSLDELWVLEYNQDMESTDNASAINGAHSIKYDLGSTESHFTGTPSDAKAGDLVEIKTNGVIYDGDIHVYVDGQEISKSHYESDYWGYSFVMPDRDVLVTARFYTKDEIWGLDTDMDTLREKYPEYFDLSTFKGLEVYVWQMGPNSYSFGVLPGTNREKTLDEMWNMKGATAKEMRTILSSYAIDKSDIIIIPWQNSISSYISEYWIRQKDEDSASVEKRQKEYIDRIRSMLFASGVEVKSGTLLKAGAINSVSVTSLPEGYAYAISGEVVKTIIDYISELDLDASFTENPNEYGGMTWVISLEYESGDVLTLYHFGNMFIRAEDGPWYKMKHEEANRLGELLNELNN